MHSSSSRSVFFHFLCFTGFIYARLMRLSIKLSLSLSLSFCFTVSLRSLGGSTAGSGGLHARLCRAFSSYTFKMNHNVFHCPFEGTFRPTITSLPKVIWEEPRRHPSRQRMHSPAACASYTMHNVTEPLQSVTEALRNPCKALRSVMEHYGSVT